MVGSLASAEASFLVSLLSSLAVVSLLASLSTSSGGAIGFSTEGTGLSIGSGLSTGATGSGGGGGGGGGGSDAVGPGGGRTPGMNEKSSASEDESEGTCSPRDARVTPRRVRFSVSSPLRPGTRISFSNSCTNRLWSLPLSPTTAPGAAEYITSVPFGAITGARPAE